MERFAAGKRFPVQIGGKVGFHWRIYAKIQTVIGATKHLHPIVLGLNLKENPTFFPLPAGNPTLLAKKVNSPPPPLFCETGGVYP